MPFLGIFWCNNGEPGRHMQAEVINAAVGYKKESSESPAEDPLPRLWSRLLPLPIRERADSERVGLKGGHWARPVAKGGPGACTEGPRGLRWRGRGP